MVNFLAILKGKLNINTFSYPYVFEMEILMCLHVLRAPEFENHIFSDWSACMLMRLCDCYRHNSKTNDSRDFKFKILHLHHMQMLLETFHGDRTNSLSTQKNSNALRPMEEFHVSEFSYIQTTLNTMKFTYIFAMFKNKKTTEYGMNCLHDLFTGQFKIIRICE